MARSSTLPAPMRPGDRASRARTTARLFRRWREEGDAAAREEIFRRHAPIARRLAARYWNALEPYDDLYQVASLGLLAAIERFDPERGVAFSTFAIPTVLGELKRYFRDTGWSAHVPRRAQELARRVDLACRELNARSRRPPQVSEIAEYLELSTEDVLTGLHAAGAHHSISLNAPLPGAGGEEACLLADSLGAEDDRFALIETTAALSGGLRRLSSRERRALSLRLEHDLKQSEIAQHLGCSQMQVSRLLRTATAKLQDSVGYDPPPGA